MTKALSRAVLIAATFAANGPAQAIVGPSVPADGLASAVVMVLSRMADGAGFCSGVVIARTVVLTAAHCLAPTEDMRIHFRDDGGNPVLLEVADKAAHPLYRADAPKTRERSIDIALVRTAVSLPGRFQAVTLDTGTAVSVGAKFRFAGFGVTQEGAAASSGKLRSSLLEARAPLSSILLWADDPRHARAGACTGDSGGPVFAQTRDILIAVIDWAAGAGRRHCGALTQAVLVAPQRGWIATVLRGWGVELRP